MGSLVAYDVDLGAPGVHRGLPSTTVTLVLPVDDPIDAAWADGSGHHRAWSCLAGLHTAPSAIHHQGPQRGVQLALSMAGARALLGMPASAWRSTMLTLDDLGPAAGPLRHLPERLAGTVPAAWAATVEQALGDVLAHREATGPRPEVGRALALLTGGAGVRESAEEVGFSRRRLTDLVRAETGVTPQEYARIARFEHSRALLGRRPLAEVAARCGYADQAHLSREWRALAGCPPTTWLREEFPYVQDIEVDGGAGWCHD